MDTDDFAYFKKWFANYVAGYYANDPAYNRIIRLKQEHTERVLDEIIRLGQALDLKDQDILLAKTTALFHDIGRFAQYRTYGTFQDHASEDHATLGLKELAKHGVLSRCPKGELSLITETIRYHNVRMLARDEDRRVLFFAKLLRDADKLDVWRVFIDYYESADEPPNATIVWGLPDEPRCSHKIVNALRLHKMADTKEMTTLNDFKLLQISWVFDVNFGPTFRAISERKYVEKIAAVLPQTGEILDVVATAQSYVHRQQFSVLSQK